MNKSRKIITFKEDVDMSDLLNSFNITVIKEMKNYNIALVEISNIEFGNLLVDPNIVSIEPEKICHPS